MRAHTQKNSVGLRNLTDLFPLSRRIIQENVPWGLSLDSEELRRGVVSWLETPESEHAILDLVHLGE